MNFTIFTGTTVCAAAALLMFHLETRRFAVTRYTIASKKLPKSFDGVRLALITDLHCQVYGENNRKLLESIEKERPDYMLIAGDMLVAKRGEDFLPAVSFLEAVSERYPVYYSYGNHECRLKEKSEHYGTMAEDYERAIGKLPLYMLHNDRAKLTRGKDAVWIYGLEIDGEYFCRFKPGAMTEEYLKRKLGKAKAEDFCIMIAHNPFYFPVYAQWGADLVVSGHNHGGIARVPFLGGLVDPNLRLFPKYDKGLFTEQRSQMVLSGGTGSHSPNFRAFNLPELVIITLKREV